MIRVDASLANLALLSDEIGIPIRLLEKEAGVGKYSVDILAEEEGTGRKIIIENQLEKTNHDHLDKIITYAAGHDASIVVWLFKDITEEHRSAVDWLNENTGEDRGRGNHESDRRTLAPLADKNAEGQILCPCRPSLHRQAPQTTICAMASNVGKLTKVDLREIWKNEEHDFSSWLAEDGIPVLRSGRLLE
jgi:hypothetical protein